MGSITQKKDEWRNSGREKEDKSVTNILDLMFNEFIDEVDDENDGILMFILRITRLTKGMAYGLVIFHKGSALLLKTLSKSKVMHSWEEPLEKTELLKIRDFKQLNDDIKEELMSIGQKKLERILGC